MRYKQTRLKTGNLNFLKDKLIKIILIGKYIESHERFVGPKDVFDNYYFSSPSGF